MNSDVEKAVKNCNQCPELKNQQPSEPLKPIMIKDLPYSMVGGQDIRSDLSVPDHCLSFYFGCDKFDFESKDYLAVTDNCLNTLML